MSTAPVSNTLLDPSGQPYDSVQVTVTLLPPITVFGPDGHEVGVIVQTSADASGHWSLPLERTDTLSQGGMTYLVAETPANGKQVLNTITVPLGGGTLQGLLTTVPSPPLVPPNPTVGNLTVTGNAGVSGNLTAAGTISSAGAIKGPLRDDGGAMTSMEAYGFVTGSGNATANGTLFRALLLEIYNGTKPPMIDADVPGDVYIAGRTVLPNSTGGTYIGAIGSAQPAQPRYHIRGRRNSAGQNVGRLIFTYVSPNATSTAGTLSAATGSATLTITGTKPPAGTVDIGFPVQVSDGTRMETAQVTAVSVSGGLINSVTVTLTLSGYSTGTGAATLGWPVRNDAKIVGLGTGDFILEDMTLASVTANDTTPFLLCTNTRLFVRGSCEIRGLAYANVVPGALHTGIWPTQDAIILGGTGKLVDGSLSGVMTGYTAAIDALLCFGIRACVVFQSAATTYMVRNLYADSTCGSRWAQGGAIESYSSFGSDNNSLMILAGQFEMVNYASGIWLGAQNAGIPVLGAQFPDDIVASQVSSTYTHGGTTIVLDGYLPERELAPELRSIQYAFESASGVDFGRFTGAPTPAHTTTLNGAVAAGATSVILNSATGVSAGVVILLDHGTYGLQEPITVAASYVSGTTIPLTSPLVFAHANAAAAWVGPFTFTLEAALAHDHPNLSGTNVSFGLAGVRVESGVVGCRVEPAAWSSAVILRDLNATPSNIVLDSYGPAPSATLPGTVTLGAIAFTGVPALPAGVQAGAGMQVGVGTSQFGADLSLRGAGSPSLEWGHSNTGGFGSTLSYDSTGGGPWIGLGIAPGTTANTYKSSGIAGHVIKLDSAGDLILGHVASASADNQSLVSDLVISSTGVITVPGTLSVTGAQFLLNGAAVFDAGSNLTLPVGSKFKQLAGGANNTSQLEYSDGGGAGWPAYLFSDQAGTWMQGLSSNGYFQGSNAWLYTGTAASWKGAAAVWFTHDAAIVLGTIADSSAPTAPTERMRIDNAGNVTITGGPLTVSGGLLAASVGLTVTGGATQLANASSASAANPTALTNATDTITGAVTDGFTGAVRLGPTINAATAQTVTRHNYIDVKNVVLGGAGPAAVTDAAVFRFDAAPGTHKALASNGSVATVLGSVGPTGAQTTVQGWLKVNVNGTLRYIPFF